MCFLWPKAEFCIKFSAVSHVSIFLPTVTIATGTATMISTAMAKVPAIIN